jgi:microcystin-dependent protein
MKKFITMAVSLFSLTVFAQVGINNDSPKATLDITAKTTDGSKPEGLLAPRLTGDQIQAGDAMYTAAQKGMIVYATAAATAPSIKTAAITTEGYYYFNGSTWQKILATSVEDPTLGSILAFPYNALPAGYLECNGAAVSRTVYAGLFAKIGTTYGAGDGSTTFNLPDLRGEFIRGWDNGRGVDASRSLGSTQNNTTALPNTSFTGSTSSYTHNHGVGNGANSTNTVSAGSCGLIRRTNSGDNNTTAGIDSNLSGTEPDINNPPRVIPNDTHSHTVTVSGGGDSETRPRNVAMVYAIKAVESVLVPSSTSTAISAAAAANEPWFKAGTTTGATANTDDVYIMGKVGIGTSTPDTSAALDITSTNKGLLIPRVALTSSTDATTISSPATGLVVYNSSVNAGGPGIVINKGTPASPVWATVSTFSNNDGSTSGKIRYLGNPDATKILTVGNFSFRFNPTAAAQGYNVEMKVNTMPGALSSITFRANRIDFYGIISNQQENNITFTSAEVTSGTWKTVSVHSGYTGTHSNLIHISCDQDPVFVRISSQERYGVLFSMVADLY